MNESAPLDPIRKAAIVLASLTPDIAAELLARLDPDSARAIEREAARLGPISEEIRDEILREFRDSGRKRSRFGFEDVARLSKADLAGAYREEDIEIWAAALAGAPKGLRSRVFASLARDWAADLRRAASGRFRLDEVSEAQDQLVERLQLLHDLGHITLPEPARQAASFARDRR